jgi:hypothetical protein
MPNEYMQPIQNPEDWQQYPLNPYDMIKLSEGFSDLLYLNNEYRDYEWMLTSGLLSP